MKKILLAFALLASATSAFGQTTAGQTVIGYYGTPAQYATATGNTNCKTGPCFIPYGAAVPTGGGTGTSTVNIDQTTPGTTNGVVTKTGSVTNTTPAQRTIVPLDVSTVTTGGTAVTALTAGHKTAGGFLTNPKAATIDLCINEQGTASGTTSAGALTCIVPGQSYTLTPSAGAVSVITSDSAHPFSGQGLN